ncbi:hypothetical protein PHYBLDRAFT_59086 [Phycomyces blakesleeanus NRRL 1555(-)]|uniref:Uncharacterized protein n=1 Tax=Phycomyces blakesleeanus (strain ATCC 8743b / DSM 1359 / FGSC 10004 / NBRC 33097 / NRRL 1555) TaxID=763407 RepID=A0A162Q4Q7_PHYB8|nr:hypothetical protein PHYBLDRAFT_59086 [Phycomyces blakesleeanus NRRL 1555(-)]OAD80046.1 hypothetical protein PHYBLDRAFT_59086 [Phycomyces blakesleeanus NRRL 1555(-)]|eukprot:XP_018298086.1 hypothetical protein PHYBLDRAFT_59086 [Phycomyces blakesleeanus NRRL 1555(-)]
MYDIKRKLRERISEKIWGKWFIILAGVQLVITIPNLIATLIIFHPIGDLGSRQDQKGWVLDGYKAIRIQAETIWFILFEVWRFWLAFDGVVQGSSLTVFLAFGSTIFAIALGIMQIVEFEKAVGNLTVNIIPHIVMTTLLLILTVPTTYVTYKLYKNCDWIIYKKLGSDVNLHRMYHWVQCYVLAVKSNLFFQVLLIIFYAIYIMLFGPDAWIWAFSICAPILSAAFLLFGRKAIADEQHWMMITFLFYQMAIIVLNIIVLVWSIGYMKADIWYFLCAYAGCSVIMCLAIQIGWYKTKKDHTVLDRRIATNHFSETMSLDGWGKNDDMMYIDPDSSLITSNCLVNDEISIKEP